MKKIPAKVYNILLWVARIALPVCGVIFFFIGKSRGEQDITFVKAIFICLECIGIG